MPAESLPHPHTPTLPGFQSQSSEIPNPSNSPPEAYVAQHVLSITQDPHTTDAASLFPFIPPRGPLFYPSPLPACPPSPSLLELPPRLGTFCTYPHPRMRQERYLRIWLPLCVGDIMLTFPRLRTRAVGEIEPGDTWTLPTSARFMLRPPRTRKSATTEHVGRLYLPVVLHSIRRGRHLSAAKP